MDDGDLDGGLNGGVANWFLDRSDYEHEKIRNCLGCLGQTNGNNSNGEGKRACNLVTFL